MNHLYRIYQDPNEIPPSFSLDFNETLEHIRSTPLKILDLKKILPRYPESWSKRIKFAQSVSDVSVEAELTGVSFYKFNYFEEIVTY